MKKLHNATTPLSVGLFIILFVAVACGASIQTLPGAKGPRVENLSPAPSGIKVLWVAVVEAFSLAVGTKPSSADREKALSRSFASGTKAVTFIIDVADSMPGGTNIGISIVCKGGPVDVPLSLLSTASTGIETRLQLTRGVKEGTFPDGPCQGTLSLNEKPISRLNWTIGQ